MDRFWDDDAGMVVEQWDRDWTTLDGYRGVNANMHSVEALLSAADVLGTPRCGQGRADPHPRRARPRAGNEWRIPEHFDADWQPVLEYNVDEPAHPFRPYGATIGHWLEWARLALDLRASLGDRAPDWLLDRRGRAVRGVRARGLVGRRCAGLRLHRRLGRSPGRPRAHALGRRGGDGHGRRPARRRPATRRTPPGTRRSGTTSPTHFRDDERGSWRHELSPTLAPSALTWAGKPDVYHAFQATLLPRLPLSPTLATALARGLLA